MPDDLSLPNSPLDGTFPWCHKKVVAKYVERRSDFSGLIECGRARPRHGAGAGVRQNANDSPIARSPTRKASATSWSGRTSTSLCFAATSSAKRA